MEILKIEGKLRGDIGKKAVKALRKENQVPCVVYGGEKNIHFSTHPNKLRGLIYTPDFKLAELNIDGKSYKTFMKSVQFNPVTDALVHVDFMELVDGKAIKLEVPVKLEGTSPGVKNGGTIQQKIRKIKIKTTPEKLVDFLTIDISELELGKSIRVRDIIAPDGVEIMSALGAPVVSVEVPRALKSADAEEETEAAPADAPAAEE